MTSLFAPRGGDNIRVLHVHKMARVTTLVNTGYNIKIDMNISFIGQNLTVLDCLVKLSKTF